MDHSLDCIRKYHESIAAFRLWELTWPNYCRKCGGWGVIQWNENGAPHGEGWWSMPMSELCEDCVGSNKTACPRCGTLLHEWFRDNKPEFPADQCVDGWVEREDACPVCGWNWGVVVGNTCPDTYECWGDCIQCDDGPDEMEEMKEWGPDSFEDYYENGPR